MKTVSADGLCTFLGVIMARSEDDYKKMIEGKNVPILTLDHNWHRIFGQSRLTPELKVLEDEVNELLKQQGKVNTEAKQIRILKKKLMDEIVEATAAFQESQDAADDKKVEENKRLVAECNEKLEALNDDMLDIPRNLELANRKLMIETMKVAFERLHDNCASMEEIDAWLLSIRAELKDHIVRRQKGEVDNYFIYLFLSEFFSDATKDLFELSYDPKEHPPKLKSQEEKS
ncbi:MAG: hypothetical protein K6G23_07050 [Lachnospiraceae bacterium]|nr:hypothetical protein [Lachnospiraceae bacterium]